MCMFLKSVYNILTFQRSPEDIPYSLPGLFLSFIFLFSVLMFLLFHSTHSLLAALWKSVLLLIITSSFTLIVLQLKTLENRFVQVLTAIYATEAFIFVICLIPYMLLTQMLPELEEEIYIIIGTAVSSIIILIASIWLYLLISHIYEAALNISMFNSLLITLIFFTLQAIVFSLLYF